MSLPDRVSELAGRWRESVLSDHSWARDADRTANPGEAGGFFVACEEIEYPAYLKPKKKCPPEHPRAAYEKIAYDLASEVGVATPPVLLFERDDCPDDEERRACVSLVVYDEQWEWNKVWNLTGPAADMARTLLAAGSGVIALDAWIDNRDRNNRRNAIFGIDVRNPSDSAFMYIDHAHSFSMNGRWASGGFETVEVPPMPASLRDAADPVVLERTLEQIEAVEDDVVNEIVGRIPAHYMNDEHRGVVIEGLLQRQELVRATLEPEFDL